MSMMTPVSAQSVAGTLGSISFARLPQPVALNKLQDDLTQLMSSSWVDHVNRKDYSGGWDVLPLRCQRQHFNAHPLLQGFALESDADVVWENLLLLDRCLHINELLGALQCPLKSVRLMRLKAGAEIKPHRDLGLSLEYGEARLHVPLQTSVAVSFIVDHKKIPMEAGELWYFNADQCHEVYNRGTEDRINLVIDCVANDWLQQQIMVSAAETVAHE